MTTQISNDEAQLDAAVGKGIESDAGKLHTEENLKKPWSKFTILVVALVLLLFPLILLLLLPDSNAESETWDFWSGLANLVGAGLVALGAWFGILHYDAAFVKNSRHIDVKHFGDRVWAFVFTGSVLIAGTALANWIDAIGALAIASAR